MSPSDEHAHRLAVEERYRVAFAFAVSRLAPIPSHTRLTIASILRDLVPSIDPLDETVSKRGVAYVAALLEHDVAREGL